MEIDNIQTPETGQPEVANDQNVEVQELNVEVQNVEGDEVSTEDPSVKSEDKQKGSLRDILKENPDYQAELDALMGKRASRVEQKLRKEYDRRLKEATQGASDILQEYGVDPDSFDTVADFTKALKTAVESKTREEIIREREELEVTERLERLSEELPDFQDAVKNLSVIDQNRLSNAVKNAFSDKRTGGYLIYELGKDVGKLATILTLPEEQQVIELEKLKTPYVKPARSKSVSNAPAPIAPVSTSKPSVGVYTPDDPRSVESLSVAEWIAARNKQDLERRNAR